MDRSGSAGQPSEGQRRAQAALAASSVYVLRDVQVQELNGQLILTGKVDSYYHKQLAQEIVRAVVRHLRIVNELEVVGAWWETTRLPVPEAESAQQERKQGHTRSAEKPAAQPPTSAEQIEQHPLR
ncbi:MAG: hypothetical protein KatS3mg110_1153 [Pirellulaceae bacterium]|nr:MAG: hypothetical protein KatS3mg110_1153 [Pirellulaceae bacterium]